MADIQERHEGLEYRQHQVHCQIDEGEANGSSHTPAGSWRDFLEDEEAALGEANGLFTA